ncbi:[NiFe] hydrogenase metallocenter assembly protein HypF [Dissulfuribacter thermophilus]|uniref:Carbamoyltransferase n=1 Tax=Dissulfuribacter thermophilus TaxID=1156395 RepID=A0A1B9F8V9_9BACT|nr:carbamoyltransferase HypF [Dissulfuribacter thermophilus]OCC16323.1 [NiFe] hydrogenase metallocenter assembly protein HypF [Dissulfuribacter thermophilus]
MVYERLNSIHQIEGLNGVPSGTPLGGRKTIKVSVFVRGVVQGVGFRPFCYRLAVSLGLDGTVRNTGKGVVIELQGERDVVEAFLKGLREAHPPLASIKSIDIKCADFPDTNGFKIVESEDEHGNKTLIPPDISICDDCLRELLDPEDPRYLYPFINCTNCGPRYTIIKNLPYDRAKTTMAQFEMCSHCESEYLDPSCRRFHAEPTACPECGPKVHLEDHNGVIFNDEDALAKASTLLRQGKVIAIKGLGGFHIAGDAFNPDTVKRIREVKNRPAKPLALMMRDLKVVKRYLKVTSEEEALLLSPKRPIVLLEKKADYYGLFELVSPNISHVGVMLPYTPLHYLLMSYYEAPSCLVMTSGNPKGDIIAISNDEAFNKLKGMVQAYLVHNRPILRPVDDSVVMIVEKKEKVIRRARGYAPMPLRIRENLPPILAFGADLKNTICIGCGDELFLSQHIGDLDNVNIQDHLEHTVQDITTLLGVRPQAVVVDMHPDYHSTRLGRKYAKQHGVPVYEVQHHHAHFWATVAEHDLSGKVLGCILDGTGFGLDGTVWGGEIFFGNITSSYSTLPTFVRLAHLEHLFLPGGDKASREPWRMAISALYSVFGDDVLDDCDVLKDFVGASVENKRLILNMMKKGVNSPKTSSAGRLFDAVSAILGLRYFNDYEGQAAMELEALAKGVDDPNVYPVAIKNRISHPWVISSKEALKEILTDLSNGVPKEIISFRFHAWLASSMFITLTNFARIYDVNQIVLSGGVFQNRLLFTLLFNKLREFGLQVYSGENIPINDGGIALGQAFGGGLIHVFSNSNGSNRG